MILDHLRRAGLLAAVLAVTVPALAAGPAHAGRDAPTGEPPPAEEPEQVDEPEARTPADRAEPAGAAGTRGPAHPCIERTFHEHTFSKDVHLRNFCGGTRYVKVIVAYGPDSGCIRLNRGGGYTWSWSVGWPMFASRLDRVEYC